jgi:hypothetical protein
MGASVSRRARAFAGVVWLLAACGGDGKQTPPGAVAGGAAPAVRAPSGRQPAPPRKVSEAEALRARGDLPANERVMVMVNGAERWVDAAAIESVGYTIVDLRDTWTPTIFAEHTTPEGVPLPNRYRRVLLGLANDQLDNDGEPLEPGEKNYLELYGVFPSLSVLRARARSGRDRVVRGARRLASR